MATKVKAIKVVGHLGKVYPKGTIFELNEDDAENHLRCGMVELADDDAVLETESSKKPKGEDLSLDALEASWPFDIDPSKYAKQFPDAEESDLARQIVEMRAAVKAEAE